MKTENQKLGDEPAFPTDYGFQENIGTVPHTGMSKRFYAACAAMNGILANPNTASQIAQQFGSISAEDANELVCKTAYKLADELLKQEQSVTPNSEITATHDNDVLEKFQGY